MTTTTKNLKTQAGNTKAEGLLKSLRLGISLLVSLEESICVIAYRATSAESRNLTRLHPSEPNNPTLVFSQLLISSRNVRVQSNSPTTRATRICKHAILTLPYATTTTMMTMYFCNAHRTYCIDQLGLRISTGQ